jgi:hypothetical protein
MLLVLVGGEDEVGKVNVAGCTGEDAEDEAGRGVDGAVRTETEKL